MHRARQGPGFFGFAAQILSVVGIRVLFLHLKLLLQRANTVCRNSSAFEPSFEIRPGRMLRLIRKQYIFFKRVVRMISFSP